jgi:hypothetical protein
VQPLVLGVLRQVRVVLQPVAQLLQAALPQPVVQLPLALEPLLRRVLQQQPQPQRWVWWLLASLLLRWWLLRWPKRQIPFTKTPQPLPELAPTQVWLLQVEHASPIANFDCLSSNAPLGRFFVPNFCKLQSELFSTGDGSLRGSSSGTNFGCCVFGFRLPRRESNAGHDQDLVAWQRPGFDSSRGVRIPSVGN